MLSSVYRFESTPPGATVLLDGQAASGTTPLQAELIPDVEYKVTVKLKGHATKQAVVKANVATDVRTLRFTLARAGSLVINSKPPGARVSIGSRMIEDRVTPMTLHDVESGAPVEVKCEITGMPTVVKSVRLKPGRKKAVLCDLTEE